MGEIALASIIAAILVTWLRSKDRLQIGSAVVIGAIAMFFVLLMIGGPISDAIQYGMTDIVGRALVGLLGFTALGLSVEWTVEKLRDRQFRRLANGWLRRNPSK
jgi:amino acid permease